MVIKIRTLRCWEGKTHIWTVGLAHMQLGTAEMIRSLLLTARHSRYRLVYKIQYSGKDEVTVYSEEAHNPDVRLALFQNTLCLVMYFSQRFRPNPFGILRAVRQHPRLNVLNLLANKAKRRVTKVKEGPQFRCSQLIENLLWQAG